VDIVSDGAIFWNGEEMASMEQLAGRFARLAGSPDAPRVNLVPEKRTRYEIVAQVLAMAQRANVRRLGLAPVEDRGF
jgi:biopolymer transport protein ExbD